MRGLGSPLWGRQPRAGAQEHPWCTRGRWRGTAGVCLVSLETGRGPCVCVCVCGLSCGTVHGFVGSYVCKGGCGGSSSVEGRTTWRACMGALARGASLPVDTPLLRPQSYDRVRSSPKSGCQPKRRLPRVLPRVARLTLILQCGSRRRIRTARPVCSARRPRQCAPACRWARGEAPRRAACSRPRRCTLKEINQHSCPPSAINPLPLSPCVQLTDSPTAPHPRCTPPPATPRPRPPSLAHLSTLFWSSVKALYARVLIASTGSPRPSSSSSTLPHSAAI